MATSLREETNPERPEAASGPGEMDRQAAVIPAVNDPIRTNPRRRKSLARCLVATQGRWLRRSSPQPRRPTTTTPPWRSWKSTRKSSPIPGITIIGSDGRTGVVLFDNIRR